MEIPDSLEENDRTETEVVQSLTAVARYFKVSQPAVSKWKQSGMPVREDRTYDLREITLWRATRAADKADNLLPATAEGLNGELTEIRGKLGRFRELAESYKMDRANVFAGAEAKLLSVAEQLLDGINPKQLAKMNVKDRIKAVKDIVSSVSGLFEKERLERGESTENVAVIVQAIKDAKKRKREEAERQANASQ